MKNKPLVIFTAFLLILSSAAAGLGYYEHSKGNDTPVTPTKKEEITYKYYVDDVEQDAMPTNKTIDEEGNEVIENIYVFTRFQCDDNSVDGNFDTDSWTFTPSIVKNTTCRLYFARSYYEVELSLSNALVEGDNPVKVERDSDAQIVINPTEGYEFSEVTCSNNKLATYDKSSKTLSISSIMENVACRVDFEIKKLKVDITVKNGKENTTENANYGQSVSAVITPNDGYDSPKINCTNNQTATFKDNELTIEKLTDNTACTVTFNKIKPKTYKFKITLPENNKVTVTDDTGAEVEKDIVTITNGSTEVTYEDGKDVTFSLKALDNYSLTLDCNGVYPTKAEKDEADKTITNYTFLKISKDITCKVTAKQD